MRTDEELKQIALDLHGKKIWTDRHCRSAQELKMSFMLIGFMDEAAMKKLEEDKVNFIFEYLDKAGPMAVNGMPVFMSMECLTEPETAKMFEYYEKIKKAVESVV